MSLTIIKKSKAKPVDDSINEAVFGSAEAAPMVVYLPKSGENKVLVYWKTQDFPSGTKVWAHLRTPDGLNQLVEISIPDLAKHWDKGEPPQWLQNSSSGTIRA